MTITYDTETIRQIIANDPDYEIVEVGPDYDGLGMIELRIRDRKTEKIIDRITFSPEIAPSLAQAILKCGEELTERNNK